MTRQSICSNWQVVFKDAHCVGNAEIKYRYLVLPKQKQNTIELICQILKFAYKIQQNFTI